MIRHMSYTSDMGVDYVRLLRDLVDERESWARKRDDAERELSRLSELIRSTIRMLSPEQRSRCDCEILLERIDNRPAGLTMFVRRAFSAGGEWLTPIEIRDYLKSAGLNFQKYKANPLASIHTTLRRMVPHEVDCKTMDGQKVYRLKTVEQWRSSIAEGLQWLEESGFDSKQKMGPVFALKRRNRDGEGLDRERRKAKGEKHGKVGSP
jgi:hypothetical protein